jgi:rare lipoprotein A
MSKYIFIIFSFILIFSGCVRRYNDGGYYRGSNLNKSAYNPSQYEKVSNSKIKNSPAMHRATMRPYTIAGKTYYPSYAHIGDTFRGIASWYGPNFHAKKTSNGEIYNMHAMTAAHKTLPMNTIVKVDNLDNGLSTVVRINDRGPFVSGRIIDLSNAAAHKIDMVKKGTARVKLTILGFNAKIATTKAEKTASAVAGEFYIQVGAFSKIDGARAIKRKFELVLDKRYKVLIKKGSINRVWISGFRSEDEAQDFKIKNDLNNAMIIAK